MEQQTERRLQLKNTEQQSETQRGQNAAQQSEARYRQNAAQQSETRHRRNSAQQNTAMRHRNTPSRKNSTVKILLWIILILQIIVAVELFALIKVLAANEQYAYKLGSKTVAGAGGQAGQNSAEDAHKLWAGESTFVANNSAGISNSEGEHGGAEDEDWKLVLVNKWNEIDPDYVPELTEIAEGHMVDSRIADALTDMINEAEKAGYYIYILSSYRDMAKQTYLYEAEVEEWLAQGYSRSGAERKAATVVAYPGTSEHHLGLAVDLVDSTHVALDEGAELTKGYKWLVEHCHEYGFILRYPNGATEITGIIYEPWHFRYVGEEAAAEIMESGMTLEEYLEKQSVVDMSMTRGGET